MWGRLCTLLVVALLAVGLPLHRAAAMDCASGHPQAAMQHCSDIRASPGPDRHHCKRPFGNSACQTLCNTLVALQGPVQRTLLPAPYAVEFFPGQPSPAQDAELPPEPFPPRS